MRHRKKFLTFAACITVFISTRLLTGCANDPVPPTSSAVAVQLTRASSPATSYSASGMTVFIQKSGGPLLSGVTGTDGKAVITVSETGVYAVIRVDGADATGLPQGFEGREYVKAPPLATAQPVLSYILPGEQPEVTVAALGRNYSVNAPIPPVQTVTVLKKGAVNIPETTLGTNIVAGTAPFGGRVILRNINFSHDNHGAIVFWSDADAGTSNRLILYPTGLDTITGSFYGGNPDTLTPLGISYPVAGVVTFEAPGNGDWALDSNGASTKARASFGGADPARNYPSFRQPPGGTVFQVRSTFQDDPAVTYQLDYEIYSFTAVI